MTWYHRGEQRFVEYGSSFSATLAEGTRQMVDDVLVNLNLLHLAPGDHAVRVAGGRRIPHRGGQLPRLPRPRAAPDHPSSGPQAGPQDRVVDAIYGPSRYFFGELFCVRPRRSSAQLRRRRRPAQPAQFGRWLVTRDGFDFLFLYLYETDAVPSIATGACWPR